MTGGSRAVQIGEKIDVVILGIKQTSLTADPAVKILVFRRKTCAAIDLHEAVLQSDDSVNKALCHNRVRNSESVASAVQAIISKLSSLFGH